MGIATAREYVTTQTNAACPQAGSEPSGDAGAARVPDHSDREYFLHERYAGARERSRALTLYYACKPLIPRAAQLAMRRRYAHRQATRRFPAWPVEPILVQHQDDELRELLAQHGRQRLPIVNFWPLRQRFAFVLTHDVEGPKGIANIARVREIERRHGCVSSWNFVAEDYPIPPGCFERLRSEGCEIGLHGITHDGKLFQSRARFEADLPKIHSYLERWGCVGFRSPATHRRAEWMHELGCLYDSSFPDTDPFEPQPGGCCSILPFQFGEVVELPITLVQDHTLLEILRLDSIDTWVQKSEWLIRHHGLINLITHPDYLDNPRRLALYDQFLAFLRDQDCAWHALPRDVAEWWRVRCRLRVAERQGRDEIVECERHAGIQTSGSSPVSATDASIAHVSLDRDELGIEL